MCAHNIPLIFWPTWQGKPEKESLRGEEGLSTYTVQESRACLLRIFGQCSGPRGGQTGKGIIERRGSIISLYRYCKSLRACVLRIFSWCSGPRGGQTGKGFMEKGRRDYKLILCKSLRACVRIIFRWYSGLRGRKPEKESWRGVKGLSTYSVQESESLRAQNIRLMCGPTWWANRKRLSSCWPRQSWGQGWNPRRPSWWETISGESVTVE